MCWTLRALQARAADFALQPRSKDYDLRRRADIDRLLIGQKTDAHHSSGRRLRRHRGQPGSSRTVFLRQCGHGNSADGGGASGGCPKFVQVGTVCAVSRNFRRAFPFAKTISGTVIRKKPTRRMGWPRKCFSSRRRRTACSMASMPFTFYRPIFMGRATILIWKIRTSSPALPIRKTRKPSAGASNRTRRGGLGNRQA